MKFYIISVILNIMILFIPVAYYTSNSSKKENKQNEPITVNLSEAYVSRFFARNCWK